jgi:hypothetical protein
VTRRIHAADLTALTLDVDDAERRGLVADAGAVIGDHGAKRRGAFVQETDLPGNAEENQSPGAESDPLKDAGRD